jgi:hypothetical protein
MMKEIDWVLFSGMRNNKVCLSYICESMKGLLDKRVQEVLGNWHEK